MEQFDQYMVNNMPSAAEILHITETKLYQDEINSS